MAARVVTFDLGGVMVDWDPRYLYRKLLPDDDAIERFLAEVCTTAWNEKQDAGRPVAEAVEEATAAHPHHAALIGAYYERFGDMIGGLIDENVALADEVRDRGVSCYALTNWCAETFHVLDDYDLLGRFDGVLVSGREGVKKPDPTIYRRFLERFSLAPSDVLFIDDVAANVAGARSVGIETIHYVRGQRLRDRVLGWLEG